MLTVDREDHVARLTLDRPQARNALNSELITRLAAELERLDVEPGVRAVVLAGAPPGFCAGSDLRELSGMDVVEMCAHEERSAALARRIGLLDTPVVAEVEGFAVGGGFVLAASCDLVVTAADARWQLPEVSLGWIPPWGLQALTARVGPVVARRLTWGIDPIDGTEAYRLGIADYGVASGEASAVALEVTRKLAALPAPAVTSTKRAFARFASGDAEVLDRQANQLFAADCAHQAAQETLERFGSR